MITRREFLETTAAGTLAAGTLAGAGKIPTRVLGKTGERVSILAIGGGSRFTGIKDEEKALETVNRALDLGITYIDTAEGYGNGMSEQRFGKVLKARGRKGLFVATKMGKRDPAVVRQSVEGSLKRLQIDKLDLVHFHALQDEADLERLEQTGVLKELWKCKEAGLMRFVGISCHASPTGLQKALERHDFDCTQMALNAGTSSFMSGRGMVPNPAVKEAFEETALPVANRKKMGVIAMKVFAQDAMQGQAEATARNLLYYALTLPVTVATVGYPQIEYLEENVRLAQEFKPLAKAEMRRISGALSSRNKAALLDRFRHHVDA